MRIITGTSPEVSRSRRWRFKVDSCSSWSDYVGVLEGEGLKGEERREEERGRMGRRSLSSRALKEEAEREEGER